MHGQTWSLMKMLVVALGVGFALAGALPASAAGLPTDLQALVTEALQANTEVKQMAALAEASREAIRPAGALDDPEFGVILKDIPVDKWSFTRDPMTQKMLEIGQKVPFPRKLSLRSEIAAEQAKSDGFVSRDKANEIRAKVIVAYWGLSLAYAGYDLTAKNKKYWEQVVQVTETRYGVGQGLQAEVLQAQVELGNYLDRLLAWRQRQETLAADLNALRAKPPQTQVTRPQPLQPRPLALKLDDLLAQAEARPQLQALKALVDKQEKAVSLARKEYFPDLTLSVGYGFRERLVPPLENPPDMFTARAMFNLPIWFSSKIQPRIREEMARQNAAREAQQSAWNTLAAAIKDRHAKLARLAQQIALYTQGIVPQARQAVEASLPAYQVGALNFAQLYQNMIAIYSTELQVQEYLKDFEENWAELEWLVGQELPRRQ